MKLSKIVAPKELEKEFEEATKETLTVAELSDKEREVLEKIKNRRKK